MSNPYIFRGPVRDPAMFFGRDHELAEIVAFLHGNQSVSIVGPRKVGKTSLLFHLLRPSLWPVLGLESNNLLVYLDCEVLGDGTHEEIFGQFACEIAATLEERELPAEPAIEAAIAQPTRISFERALRRLNQRGLRVVLVLDEFERISTNPHLDVNFFNALRSAAGRYQFAFITASARPLIQLTYSNQSQEILSSPFFNIFAPLYLSLLPEDEARQAIRVPAMQAGLPFSPKVEDFIFNLAGGFPLGLQVSCFHAMEVIQSTQEEDLAEIERRAILELSPHFEYYWRNLNVSEQETLQRLTELADREPNDTTLRAILRDLVQKCLLVSDGKRYRYPMGAWASFIQSRAPAATPTSRTSGSFSGLHLGPYEVLEPLGHGGMAEVYKGHHPRLDRTVAIKILPARLAVEADFRKRFEREARAVASLKHPNIVQVFDFGDVEGTYYMVMEYIRGQDLAQFIRERAPLDLTLVRALLCDLAGALDYAHSQGVVHRDVKPSNVLLEQRTSLGGPAGETSAGAEDSSRPLRAVLTDFGIAKIFSGDTAATKTGILMGTLDYMSPEQIRSSGEVDHRADIYALGAMIYQMLTGQLPFKGENPGVIMFAHLQHPAPDPRLILPDLPSVVARAILRALSKDPAERFATAGELAQAICS